MIAVTFRGVNYNIPEPTDAFTQSLTDFLNALSTGAVGLPTTGDVDFGASFGIKALYFITRTANPAATGVDRLAVGDTISWRNNANSNDVALSVNGADQILFNGVPISRKRVVLVYGASVALDASQGDQFVVTPTDGAAFTMASPTNGVIGQRITVRVINTFGALGAVTWAAAYKLAAWTQPANTFSRAIIFEYNGSWIETARTPADVPN